MILEELRYDNPSDVSLRLHKTVVMYRGSPVIILDCLGNLRVIGQDILSGETIECHSSDTDLEIASPSLGWCQNKHQGVMYLTRSARNSQRQGIVPSYLRVFLPNNENPRKHVEGYYWESVAHLKPLARTILNDFPSIHEVLEKQGGPFDRAWCLGDLRKTGNHTLYHHHVPVGVFRRDSKDFVFAHGRLSKTRKMQLFDILMNSTNSKESYNVIEHNPS